MGRNDKTWINENIVRYLVEENTYELDLLFIQNDSKQINYYHGDEKILDEIESIPSNSGEVQFISNEDKIFMLLSSTVFDSDEDNENGKFIAGYLLDEALL